MHVFQSLKFLCTFKGCMIPGSSVFEISIFQTTSNKYDNRLGSNLAKLGSFFVVVSCLYFFNISFMGNDYTLSFQIFIYLVS